MKSPDEIFRDVQDEYNRATEKYPAFNSCHEGYAVLAEEVDELWDEVKVRQGRRDIAKLYKEAIQVAAMAMRFANDLGNGERGQR